VNDFGSSLFKVQSGSASFADVLSVLRNIIEDERARQWCSGLSNLVNDMAEKDRQDHCESMVSVYFANHAPVGDPPPKTQVLPYDGSVYFVNQCCPPPYSKWTGHVRADYDKKGKPTRASMTAPIGEVLVALEHLWGVPGHLVIRR
jgi:hypothetical protein